MRIIKPIILIVAFTAFLNGCSENTEQLPPPIPSVKTFTVGELTKGHARRLSGYLSASEEAVLSFPVGGTLNSVLVVPGDEVKKGQILARLNSRPFELALQDAQAKLQASRARLQEVEQRYKRIKNLANSKFISVSELNLAEAELSSARAHVASAQSQLEDAEQNVLNTVMLAPFSGSISQRTVDPFEEIKAGDRALIISSQDQLQVEVLVPETLIQYVEFGQKVIIDFPALKGISTDGMITEIASKVAGTAYPVKVRLMNSPPELRVGMSAAVTFNFQQADLESETYMIPISALNLSFITAETGQQESATIDRRNVPLLVFNPETSQLEKREVMIGELRGNQLEVYSGLQEGEQIVTGGVAMLRDGMTVRVWTPEMGLAR